MLFRSVALMTLIFLFFSCNTHHIKDPRSPKLNNICSTSIKCYKKTKAECAVALYLKSKKLLNKAHKFSEKQFYLSTQTYASQALCCLEKAKSKIKNAKLDNFDDYQIVMLFGLDKKIEEQISACNSILRRVKWK